MKLIKIVYIAHGWHLALIDSPLIHDTVQAWKYGPVIESLYHGFKRYGNSNIPKSETASLAQALLPEATSKLLEKVWGKYSSLSAIHLSSLTHQPGTPWHTVWELHGGKNQQCAEIPDELIQKFYKSKLETKTGSGH